MKKGCFIYQTVKLQSPRLLRKWYHLKPMMAINTLGFSLHTLIHNSIIKTTKKFENSSPKQIKMFNQRIVIVMLVLVSVAVSLSQAAAIDEPAERRRCTAATQCTQKTTGLVFANAVCTNSRCACSTGVSYSCTTGCGAGTISG